MLSLLNRGYMRKPRDDPLCGLFVAFRIISGGITMPRKQNYYEPDAIDCNTMVSAIGSDFGLQCDITTSYERDQVVVLVRCYSVVQNPSKVVQVQALTRAPLRTARSLYTMQYSALLDCWHQLDRGVLAAATRPIERGWDGRPRMPAARHAK